MKQPMTGRSTDRRFPELRHKEEKTGLDQIDAVKFMQSEDFFEGDNTSDG
jgi:hypothetical protein